MLRNIAKKFLLFIIITNVLSSCNEEPFDWSFGGFKIENVSNIVETTTNSAKIRTTIGYKGNMYVDSVKHTIYDYKDRTVKAVKVGDNEYESEFNVLTAGCYYNCKVNIWVNGSSDPITIDRNSSDFNFKVQGELLSLPRSVIKVLKDSVYIGIVYNMNNYIPLNEVELGIVYTTNPSYWENSKPILYESNWNNSSDSCLVCLKELAPNTVYYFRSYLKHQEQVYYGNIDKFKTLDSETKMTNNSVVVDLGLSVYWAKYNVGALNPWEYGDYYAWGEIQSKSEYTEDNSLTYHKDFDDISGNAVYDVARAKWGGQWRIPTVDEMRELLSNCKWNWVTIMGHKGYLVVGPNLNSIFIPQAGFKVNNDVRDWIGEYWCSTPNVYGKNDSCTLYFMRNPNDLSEMLLYLSVRPRYIGLPIRPVSD